MALFTKLFEKSHDPYSIPGARWYKVKATPTELIESDIPDIEFTPTSSSISILFPAGYSVLAIQPMYGGTPGGSTAINVGIQVRISPDGRQGFYSTTLQKLTPKYTIYFLAVRS